MTKETTRTEKKGSWKFFISYDQAVKLLPDTDEPHTFRDGGIAIVGCNWSREELLKTMKKYESTLELTGENASKMHHGLALFDNKGALFIETKEDIDFRITNLEVL